MPLSLDRQFIVLLMTSPHIDGRSNRTSNRPPTIRRSASAVLITALALLGSCVSAWRNNKTSPRLTFAPSFICRARPQGAVIHWTGLRAEDCVLSRYDARSAGVSSVLPPSTTMSSSKPSEAVCASVAVMVRACGVTGECAPRMLKQARRLTRPPRRAKTRRSAGKAAASEGPRRTLWGARCDE